MYSFASRDKTAGVPPYSAFATNAKVAYEEVDVAIIMESTYPFLKGGVSAVVHDIVCHNPDLSYGIIHITWDRASPLVDLYGVPGNVKWVHVVFLSMQEHKEAFQGVSVDDLRMTSEQRKFLANKIFDAIYSLSESGKTDQIWELIDDGFNERTRSYPMWAILASREFLSAFEERVPYFKMSLSDCFWLLRNFFSLAYAVLGTSMPKARVYHAHTTGYASLLGAAAARDHGTSFLLTEHNLYVRDTINTLLDRNMALPVVANDYRILDVTDEQRAWMAWWIEMGRFCYPSASLITYLYPAAITEAARLGGDIKKSVVVPNGMVIEQFESKFQQRQRFAESLISGSSVHRWRIVNIARVVPIKGLLDLLSSIALLRDRGFNVQLDVLGPTEHVPEYFEACLARIYALNLVDCVTLHGTVNVLEKLDQFDLLVLPSYNEGQPIVILEAMAAGIPIVASDVGGVAELIKDYLVTPQGRILGSCGVTVTPGDIVQIADAIQEVISNRVAYVSFHENTRPRVQEFFQMRRVMSTYNQMYRKLGGLPSAQKVDEMGVSTVRRMNEIDQILHSEIAEVDLISFKVRPWISSTELKSADVELLKSLRVARSSHRANLLKMEEIGRPNQQATSVQTEGEIEQ